MKEGVLSCQRLLTVMNSLEAEVSFLEFHFMTVKYITFDSVTHFFSLVVACLSLILCPCVKL